MLDASASTPVSIIEHPSYGPAAPEANWIPAPRYLMRRSRVFHHLKGIEPCRVLDIGCGPAVLLSELAQKGFDTYGVDNSEQALALAKAFGGQSTKLYPSLDPRWRGKFDLLFSFEVIEHLEEDLEAIADWREYLKPGGQMILSTPAHPSRWNAADVWAGHVRRYTRTGLTDVIERAGFEIDLLECYGFPVANFMESIRARAYGRVLKNADKAEKSMLDLTHESGSDRGIESRFWRTFASWPATLAMRAACQAQRPFLQTDFGNGYLVVARRR